jgi:hypothetical protein
MPDTDFLCYFIGYWRAGICDGVAVLARGVWDLRGAVEAAQEG